MELVLERSAVFRDPLLVGIDRLFELADLVVDLLQVVAMTLELQVELVGLFVVVKGAVVIGREREVRNLALFGGRCLSGRISWDSCLNLPSSCYAVL